MKKMTNSAFRQIRMAALAALAAFACAGTARAKDVRVYYQVATQLDVSADFNSSDSDEKQRETLSYYSLYSVSREKMNALLADLFPSGTTGKPTSAATMQTWLRNPDTFWYRKGLLMQAGAVKWNLAKEYKTSLIDGQYKKYLRGTRTFPARTVTKPGDDERRLALYEDAKWILLYCHKKVDNKNFNSVRVTHCNCDEVSDWEIIKKYALSGKYDSTADCPVVKGGLDADQSNAHIAFGGLGDARGDVTDLIKIGPTENVTIGSVTNASGFVYDVVEPNANYYGIDKNTTVVVNWRAAEGYSLRNNSTSVLAETYTQSKKVTQDFNLEGWTVVAPQQQTVKDDAGADANVKVSEKWLSDNNLTADDLTNTGKNDIVVWQNYVLGLNPNDKTSQTVLTPVQTDDATTLTLTLGNNFAPKADAGVDVTYQLGTKDAASGVFSYGSEQDDWEFEVPLPSTGVKYYSIRAKFYGTPQQ